MSKSQAEIKSGQIRYVDFSDGDFAKQGGARKGCEYSPRIWVIPLTTKTDKAKHLPMHIFIPKTDENGLKFDSVALVEQADFVLRDKIGDLVGNMESHNLYSCGRAWINNCDCIFSPNIVAIA
jgi:mRNA-degrading endonuclease toxin of MazEF toxin-antitoxin module